VNELFGPFASFCKVDETSVGAGWNACRQGHGKQAPTEDDTFEKAKKLMAKSAPKSLAMRGLAKYLVFQAGNLNQNGVKTTSPFSLRQIGLLPGIQDTREELQNAFILKR